MSYVYDVSFVGALIIPDEKNLSVEKTHQTIDEKYSSQEDVIFTPHLLWYEISNIFNNLLKRKRYSYEKVMQFYPLLAKFRLTTDFETGVKYSQKLLNLCNEYNLSSYDAAYLELADRKKATLCTLDNNLKTAAKKHGVKVLSAE